MMEQNIEKVLAKHFSGEMSEQDQRVLRQWLNANQQNREEFNRIGLAYQVLESKSSEAKKTKALSDLTKRIHGEKVSMTTIKSKRVNLFWYSIAATIIIFISLSALFYFQNSSKSLVADVADELVVKANPAGQKLKIFLPDGSIVWLNSESSLTYLSEFSDSNRVINLKGEAYFEVFKDPTRPFTVVSGDIKTTALGTSFNIDAFNSDNITVSLTSGSVNVQAMLPDESGMSVILQPGEGISYNTSNAQPLRKIVVDIDAVRLWKDGILKLTNATMEETVKTLERWYGVKISIVNDKGKDWKVNGIFDNEYLDNVLNSLGFSQGFAYSIQGKNVLITIK